MSVLRRCASAHIYVRQDQLEKREGRYWLRLSKPSQFLEADETWGASTDLVPMFSSTLKGTSSEAVAVSMSAKENSLAEKIDAPKVLYTMILGPESETVSESKTVRTTRWTLVRGVFRAVAPKMIEPIPLKGTMGRRWKLPKGVTCEPR